MLRFRLDDRLRFEPTDTPEWAYVLGKESLTIPGQIVCAEGEIRVRKSVGEAAALAVRADFGAAGSAVFFAASLTGTRAPFGPRSRIGPWPLTGT